jgi:GAF domain-containing protein
MDYPADPNEGMRLVSIDQLDVAKHLPSATVDRITAFARDRFRVSTCLVTIIEAERQLILLGWKGPSETPRNVAFCTHTILTQEVMVVSDARKDERFKNNPLVTGEPFIRFYAGAPLSFAPLTYPGAVRLGSLCLIDQEPRMLIREEKAELARLADLVVSIILARAFNMPEPDISAALRR